MDLTGIPLLLLLALICVAAPVALMLIWDRVPGVRAVRLAQRAALVLVCQLSAVLLAAAAVNDYFSLYDSWSDLFGTSDSTPVAGPQHAAGGRLSAGALRDEGGTTMGAQVLTEEVTGPRSGVRAQVWLVLPPAYGNRVNAHRAYPLLEFLPGYPGQPQTWLHALHLADAMTSLISSGRVQPFVAVLPVMTVDPPRDTECTNVPGGPAVATWLAQDVPEVVSHQLRIRPPAKGWGVIGYSTGGFCAAKLALQYPRVFHAAASLSGYYRPATDPTTAGLFQGDPRLLTTNSPTWLAGNGHQPAVDILAVSSPGDRDSWSSTQLFLRSVRPPVSVDTLYISDGGHNPGVWNAVLPQSLSWLLQHLARPATHVTLPAPGSPIRALPYACAPGAVCPASSGASRRRSVKVGTSAS
jgi:Putative esterase